MRRKLDKWEKEANEKGIKRMEERNIQLIDYLIPKTELELKFGIEASYKKLKNDYEEAIKGWKEELDNNKKTINALKEQNEKGVEVKNKLV